MAETIRGVGVVWGIGSDFAATGTGMGTFLPQGVDFDVEADEVEIPDYKGETVVDVFFNEKNTLKMEVIPKGSTLTLARAANVLPSPGAIITVVDTNDTEIAGADPVPSGGGTRYLFVRGSKRKSTKDVVKLNFELKRMVANDISATPGA